jgi:preprotein translocase subunit SecG
LFSKLTAVFAAMFFATSLTLAYIGARPSAEPASVLERAAQAATAAQPATPAPAPTAPATPTPNPAPPK